MPLQELPWSCANVCSFDHAGTNDSSGLEICCCAESGVILQFISQHNTTFAVQSTELEMRHVNLREAYTGPSPPLPCYLSAKKDYAGNHRRTEIWLSASFGLTNVIIRSWYNSQCRGLWKVRCSQACHCYSGSNQKHTSSLSMAWKGPLYMFEHHPYATLIRVNGCMQDVVIQGF